MVKKVCTIFPYSIHITILYPIQSMTYVKLEKRLFASYLETFIKRELKLLALLHL